MAKSNWALAQCQTGSRPLTPMNSLISHTGPRKNCCYRPPSASDRIEAQKGFLVAYSRLKFFSLYPSTSVLKARVLEHKPDRCS